MIKKKRLKHWLDFLVAMTEKEIKARYKHAVLGFLWMFLNPLLQMLIIGFVFQFFVPIDADNYFLFLLSGLLPWNFFAMTVQKNTPMFFYERNLIKKAVFPRETIILSIVLSNLFHLLISIALLLVFIILVLGLNAINLGWLLIGLGWLLLITTSLSLLLSTWHVKFRDINFMVQAGMPLWFYLTPVIYNLELVPMKWRDWLYLNPLAPIVEIFRFGLLGYKPDSYQRYIPALVMTVIITFLSAKIFNKQSPEFDDWM